MLENRYIAEKGGKNWLKINEIETKYILELRQIHRTESFKVNYHTCKRVRNFKYLSANINEDANSHEEVKSSIIAANR